MQEVQQRRTVNIALIGSGFIGKEHAKAYSLAPVSCPDIAATPVKKILCDTVPDKVAERAKLWGFEEYTTDYKEILNRDDIDIVDIRPGPTAARAKTSPSRFMVLRAACAGPEPTRRYSSWPFRPATATPALRTSS